MHMANFLKTSTFPERKIMVWCVIVMTTDIRRYLQALQNVRQDTPHNSQPQRHPQDATLGTRTVYQMDWSWKLSKAIIHIRETNRSKSNDTSWISAQYYLLSFWSNLNTRQDAQLRSQPHWKNSCNYLKDFRPDWQRLDKQQQTWTSYNLR